MENQIHNGSSSICCSICSTVVVSVIEGQIRETNGFVISFIIFFVVCYNSLQTKMGYDYICTFSIKNVLHLHLVTSETCFRSLFND